MKSINHGFCCTALADKLRSGLLTFCVEGQKEDVKTVNIQNVTTFGTSKQE